MATSVTEASLNRVQEMGEEIIGIEDIIEEMDPLIKEIIKSKKKKKLRVSVRFMSSYLESKQFTY